MSLPTVTNEVLYIIGALIFVAFMVIFYQHHTMSTEINNIKKKIKTLVQQHTPQYTNNTDVRVDNNKKKVDFFTPEQDNDFIDSSDMNVMSDSDSYTDL